MPKIAKILTLLIVLPITAAECRAQFLEKLEAAVKAQLEQADKPSAASPQTGGSEAELPPPVQRGSSANLGNSNPGNTVPPPIPRPADAAENASRNTLQPSVVPEDLSSPSAAAMPTDLASRGRVYLGLSAEDVTGGGIGVRIAELSREGPAWKAGFRVGDRILAINGFAIANLESMVERVGMLSPGDTVRFLMLRDGRNQELVLVAMDADLVARINERAQASAEPWLGLTVKDLTPAFREQFGTSAFTGAAVARIEPRSPAARAGIQAGDTITEVNGQPVESARDFNAWFTNAAPGTLVEMIVVRGTFTKSVSFLLEAKPDPNAPAPRTTQRPRATADAATLSVPTPASSPATAAPTTILAPSGPVPTSVIPTDPATAGEMPVPDSELAELNELRSEVQRLRETLRETQERLRSTEAKLKKIQGLLE